MKFNADQQACIECDENLLIVAPPGSGKTGTLVAKAARILRDPNARVAMVTFTRASANEMSHRMVEAVGKSIPRRRLEVSTFHSHAIRQLMICNRLGAQVKPHQQAGLTFQAIDRVKATKIYGYKEAREEIEAAKRKLGFTGEESELVAAYQDVLRRHRATDLMDVSRLAVLGMRNGTVKPLDFTHILGDEFQDADEIQLEWILAHGPRSVLTCVGDDDQAIYGFRGSMGYAGMEQFKERASARHINLQVNYRSLECIIQASQAVIVHNPQRIEKTVLCARGEGGTVKVIKASSVSHEADTVVDLILSDLQVTDQDMLGEVAVPKGRWAVIGRTNQSLRAVAIALRDNEIPYTRQDEKDELEGSFYTMLLLLNALQTGDNMMLEAALLNLGFSNGNLANLHAALGDAFGALLEGDMPAELKDFDPEAVKRLRELCGLYFPAWRAKVRLGYYQLVVDDVAAYMKSSGLLERNADPNEFFDNVKRLKRRNGSLTAMTRPFLEPRKSEKEGGGVALFTMHGCKGLEFDNVAVVRCNEGVLPSPLTDRQDEERRLFYVAMTRARKQLFVLWSSGVGDESPLVKQIPMEMRTA